MIANIANLIHPILPNASKIIKEMLNIDGLKWEEELIKGEIRLKEVKLLYNRIDNN